MYKIILFLAFFSFELYAGTKVLMKTSAGNIEIELFDKKSSEFTRNFLKYVDEGFYKKTLFHRVIDNYIIQGGGYDN